MVSNPLDPLDLGLQLASSTSPTLAELEAEKARRNIAELEAERRRRDADKMRQTFALFAERLWHVVDPKHPYKSNHASRALVAHLQAVAEGKILKLAIALPPGLGKTTHAVLWCAWLWARDPAHRIIYASYVHGVAADATAKVRRLVESPEFKALYPDVALRPDQNRLDDVGTTAGGRLFACGIGGSLTSVRADLAIVDDSLNAADALSSTKREEANRWFEHGLETRVDGDVRVVAIQQRLHSSDLIGFLAERGDAEMLVLPAEFEPSRACRTSIWADPRTEPGELLAPGILSRSKLDEFRKKGSAVYSCQMQQNPVDNDGGLLRREWWSWWKPDGTSSGTRRPAGCSDEPAVALPPKFERVIASVDATFKAKASSDYVVAVVAGIVGARRYVLEVIRRRMDYGPTKRMIQDLARRYPSCTILLEDSANGTGIVSELVAEVPRLIAVPTRGDSKEERIQRSSPQVEARQVFLPEGHGWVGEFVAECAAYPRGDHDDQPDAMAQLLNYAADKVRTSWPELQNRDGAARSSVPLRAKLNAFWFGTPIREVGKRYEVTKDREGRETYREIKMLGGTMENEDDDKPED